MPFVAPIVEGHGEIQAVPVLLRRLHRAVASSGRLEINAPFRVEAAQFLHDATLRDHAIRFVAAKARPKRGLVLILLDADARTSINCPAQLGPALAEQARKAAGEVPVLVVLAEQDYESWFLAASESLRGLHGLAADFDPPANHARLRDAKGRISAAMAGGDDPVRHQLLLTRSMDLDAAARGNASFRRLRDRLATIWSA